MTNKPKVKRYDDMGCPEQICRVDTMHESDDGDYVLYEDYEALQSAYEEELFQVRQDRDTHFGELMRALEQVDAMKAECEKLRAAMIEAKSYIDHYMYGGSSYREPAAKAIALIDAALAAHRQGDEE